MRISTLAVALATLSLLPHAARAQAVGAGINADASAAAQRVMLDALQHGATHGGCSALPAGWARLLGTVRFPKAYGGYPQWVNSAELLPVGDNLKAFVKSGSARGAFTRPALRVGDWTVTMTMCAPAGFAYWVLVDSGMARVVVGEIAFARAGATYRRTFTAPPLH